MRLGCRTRITLIGILGLVFLHFAVRARAQTQTLKVDVNLVLVNTTISDLKGRLVAGLERQQFRLWEDDVEQNKTLNISP